MSDSMNKRKYAGEPIKDRRKRDQDPARIPPHKKERRYKLITTRVEHVVETETTYYPSRASRNQAQMELQKKHDNPPRWRKNYVQANRAHNAKYEIGFQQVDEVDGAT